MPKTKKMEIFKLLLKHPEFAGHLRWTDPRKPGLGMRWTRTDLDLYKSMGGRFGSFGTKPRSKRSRSLKGGRRTDAERAEGAKCADKNDFLTLEPISPERAFRLGKVCFDIVSLRNYITDNDSQGGRIVHNKNPFTQQVFTELEYKKINKKLSKLGLNLLGEIELDQYEKDRRLEYFDAICERLKHYQILDEYDYEDRRNYFIDENFPDPFEFTFWELQCTQVPNINQKGLCRLQIGALEDEYYGRD